MKSIIFLCLMCIVGIYVFLQWNGSRTIGSDKTNPSSIAMSSNSAGLVLGIDTIDLQGRVASAASVIIGSVTSGVRTRFEDSIRGQVIDQILRQYDQLEEIEKTHVKESVCR